MRKAYLGFLLAARSYADKNASWRRDASGVDIFQAGEDWEKKSKTAFPGANSPRSKRNNNPVHDSPSSQGSSVSMAGVQRGRGKDILLHLLLRTFFLVQGRSAWWSSSMNTFTYRLCPSSRTANHHRQTLGTCSQQPGECWTNKPESGQGQLHELDIQFKVNH